MTDVAPVGGMEVERAPYLRENVGSGGLNNGAREEPALLADESMKDEIERSNEKTNREDSRRPGQAASYASTDPPSF